MIGVIRLIYLPVTIMSSDYRSSKHVRTTDIHEEFGKI